MTKKGKSIRNLILTAMFIAIGYVLPFLTGQIPQIGSMLSPMHIPAFLCGFICGAPFGAICGFVMPLLRGIILGMPPLFPTALAMAFELAAYGALAGLFYALFGKKDLFVIPALIISMLGGRLVYGGVMWILLAVQGKTWTLSAFLASAFVKAVPGIILHIVLVPLIVIALSHAHLIDGRRKTGKLS